MELPFHLQTLEPLPGALDIIRYLGRITTPDADVDEICDALDMSDRRFNKAIRRLVTKGYVQMTGDMVYALSKEGRAAAQILAQYDVEHPRSASSSSGSSSDGEISTKLVVAMPRRLVAQQANPVIVGIDGSEVGTSADLVVRLSVINGDPFQPEDALISLEGAPVQYAFTVTPDAYDKVRVRIEVYQFGPNPDDINVSGGLYVDADVIGAADANQPMIAYASDIKVLVLE